MNDQPLWIPNSNAVVVNYIAPARELLAPDMPAGDPAQLARASELIEQHRQNAPRYPSWGNAGTSTSA